MELERLRQDTLPVGMGGVLILEPLDGLGDSGGAGKGPSAECCPGGYHRGSGALSKVDTKGFGEAQEVAGLKVIPSPFLSGYSNNAKGGVRHVAVVRVRGSGF